MATSTSTLLDTVNSVLRDLGERPTTGLVPIPAAKCVDAIQDGLQELLDANDWLFSQSRTTASSWSSQTATLPSFRRLLGVSVQLSAGVPGIPRPLTYEEFIRFTPAEGTPTSYYQSSETTVELNPYPAAGDTDLQGNIFFNIVLVLTPPSLATDVFPVPERYLRFIRSYALAQMYEKHLDDRAMSALEFQKADRILGNLIRREPGKAIGGRSMWRGGRSYR